MIRVIDFWKRYRETVAVRGLSFEVAPGQILGLIGPNGAGKTTTLRALSGIIPPSLGRLAIAGFDLATEPVEAKRRLAYIPDDPRLFESLTVWEHLQFVASAYDVEAYADKSARLLADFDLAGQRDTIAHHLSRGMRQKVAIACAYLHDPLAILFDEPLTGLDPRAIRVLKDSIVQRAGAGAAVLVSSHLLALVEDLCTHLLILHEGVCRFFGPINDARAAAGDLADDASLEEVFFRATDQKRGGEER